MKGRIVALLAAVLVARAVSPQGVLQSASASGDAQEATRVAGSRAAAPSATVSQLVVDLKAAGVRKVAVVAAKGALRDAQPAQLLTEATRAGITILLKDVEIGSAESVRAALEIVATADVEAVLPLGDAGAIAAIVQEMRNLAVKHPALIRENDARGATRLVKRSALPFLDTVLGFKRPETDDLISLKNGDKATGTVLNESIRLRTSHNFRLELPTRMLAAIVFEGQALVATVVTVNANRFSGFIENPALVVKLTVGGQLQVSKKRINRVIFHTRPNELAGVQRNNVLVLHTGEVLTGTVRARTFASGPPMGRCPSKQAR